jgi:cytochrome c biogenesis protein
MESQENIETRHINPLTRARRWLWRFFSSVKLALILILVIVGLSLVGAFVNQVPPQMKTSAETYSAWVNQVGAEQVGPWSQLLYVLQVFDIFHSVYFIAAGVLLMLNILICSLNRWGNIKLSLNGGAVKRPEDFFVSGKDDTHTELVSQNVTETQAAELSEKVLKQKHYRVRTHTEGGNVYLAADRNRWFKLGTYISHLSLILFVIAFMFGSLMGWHVYSFTVSQGSDPANNPIGHDTNLTLRLDNFQAAYYDNGSPKDYSSDVTLFENGQQVKQATIKVNHPLTYNGITIYQSTFGSALRLKVNEATPATDTTPAVIGDLIFDQSITLASMGMGGSTGSGYDIGEFELPAQNLVVYVITSTTADDPMVPADTVGIEMMDMTTGADKGFELISKTSPGIINNLQFTYVGNSTYSGFEVSKDPTVTLIWISSALFIIGICMVLYFPYRQTWILAQKTENGTRVSVRTLAPRSFTNKAEIDNISRDLKAQLK